MTFTDEILIAYLDGEADPATAAALLNALDQDPELASRLERHRALASRVKAAFAPVATETPPTRLTALLGLDRSGDSGAIELQSYRPAAAPGTWRGVRSWGAMAACLAVGLLVGLAAPRGPQGLIGDDLSARSQLASALDEQLSGGEGELVRIGLSFADREGRLCRTFTTPAMAGVACREDLIWRLEVTAPQSPGAGGEYRTASTETPLAVLERVDALIAGEPFEPQQERAARARGWQADN